MDGNQQTYAVRDTPTGERIELPATILTAEDAALLGEYESWLSRERLIRKLYCTDCGTGDEMQAFVQPWQIGLICQHRMLFYEGSVSVVETVHPQAGEGLTVVRVVVPEVPIGTADAYMLRRYQKFLRHYWLQEALWCLQCEDEEQPSGLKAYVTVSEMALICRCQARIHRGLTL